MKYHARYFRLKMVQPMFPWTPDFPMKNVSVTPGDAANGSPKPGDMIAFNPEDTDDRWLISERAMRLYEELHIKPDVSSKYVRYDDGEGIHVDSSSGPEEEQQEMDI